MYELGQRQLLCTRCTFAVHCGVFLHLHAGFFFLILCKLLLGKGEKTVAGCAVSLQAVNLRGGGALTKYLRQAAGHVRAVARLARLFIPAVFAD